MAQGAKYLNLKKKIAEFATTSKHPTVLALKEQFETEGQGVIDKVSWDDHWQTLQKDAEWSDEVMVQMTAYFLDHDIQLVLTTGVLEQPFKTIQGNIDHMNLDCTMNTLWIGFNNSLHFQSLLLAEEVQQSPEEDSSMKSSQTEDKLRASATTKKCQDQSKIQGQNNQQGFTVELSNSDGLNITISSTDSTSSFALTDQQQVISISVMKTNKH